MHHQVRQAGTNGKSFSMHPTTRRTRRQSMRIMELRGKVPLTASSASGSSGGRSDFGQDVPPTVAPPCCIVLRSSVREYVPSPHRQCHSAKPHDCCIKDVSPKRFARSSGWHFGKLPTATARRPCRLRRRICVSRSPAKYYAPRHGPSRTHGASDSDWRTVQQTRPHLCHHQTRDC